MKTNDILWFGSIVSCIEELDGLVLCLYTILYVCVCVDGYVPVNPKWHTIMFQYCYFSF
jgi:hypothetical protein